ncbi:MAG: HEAT repeat domain-containing protein [candidate division Zixibacteria bacterium]|nr:HEAT repeat domain-containing protein [candidate division Zixibacteria bacterium]
MRKIILSLLISVMFVLPIHAELTQETVDSMFVIASSGANKYRDMVEPTIVDMAEYKAEIVPFLIEKLNTIEARERVTLENIFKKIKEPAIPLLNEALIQETDSMWLSRVALILYYLPDESSIDNLLTVVEHDYYWLRYQAVRALGKIGNVKGKEAVVQALKDKNELVRTMAALATGRIVKDKELFDILVPALNDSYYGVRYTAFEALKGLDCEIKTQYLSEYLNAAKSDMELKFLYKVMIEDSCMYINDGFTKHKEVDSDPVLQTYHDLVFYKDAPEKSPLHSGDDGEKIDALFYERVASGLIKRNEEKAAAADSR